MELLTDFDLTLVADDVIRGEGADPVIVRSKKPSLLHAADLALEEGYAKLHPAAMIHHPRLWNTATNGFSCRMEKNYPARFWLTIWQEPSRWSWHSPLLDRSWRNHASSCMGRIRSSELLSMAWGMLLWKSLVSRSACASENRPRLPVLTASTPLSPGEPEWPVEIGHPQIFALLDPSRVGITLTSGGMMIPKKSISFVVGIGPDMSRDDFCELCSFNERCRYRHA